MSNQQEKQVMLTDGRVLGYAEFGDPIGKPLFFFHGWPGSRLHAKQIAHLAKKLHVRIIAPDRPGYGISDLKKNRKLLDWPEDVAELAAQLQIKRFAVLGISGGGPYAAVCAYKLAKKVTHAGIVVGLGPITIQDAFYSIAPITKALWQIHRTFPAIVPLYAAILWLEAKGYIPDKFSFAYRAKADREVIKEYNIAQVMKENRQAAFQQGSAAATLDLRLYASNWGFQVKDIRTKVSLWYGQEDRQVSVKMGEYYAAQIPQSTLTVYPQEGHLLYLSHAIEILQTLTANS